MTRKKDTDPDAPKQVADLIPAGGLSATMARIEQMRKISPLREPGDPAGRGPLPPRSMPVSTPPIAEQQPRELELLSSVPETVPVTPKDTSPISNELARTPLFAPIQRGRRLMHDKKKLPSPEGINIWYSGKQLDMGDEDTYLVALMLARGQKPDKPIKINRAEFLRLMGKKKSGAAFKWLEDSFDRISSGRLYYNYANIDMRVSVPLLGPLVYSDGEYFFTIPKESLRTFDSNRYGHVDWEKRRKIGISLAKWIQGYALSHAKGEHKISVANLRAWSTVETENLGRERQFRAKLKESLAELVKTDILKSWEMYDRDTKIKWIR